MKFNKKFLLAGVALAGSIFAGAMFATQSKAATSNLNIDAVIVEAITVSCGTNLDFGDLFSGASDTITVTTSNTRTEASGTDNLYGGGAAVSGICSIGGADGIGVDINIPDTTLTGGGSTLEVSNYTFAGTNAAGAAGNDFTISALPVSATPTDYTIGADLNIVAGDTAGTYTGFTTVTVSYQ